MPFSFVYIEHKRIRKISVEDTFIDIFDQKIFVRSPNIGNDQARVGGGRRTRRIYAFGYRERQRRRVNDLDVILKRLLKKKKELAVDQSICQSIVMSTLSKHQCLILFHNKKEEEDEEDTHEW